jgi:type II secretory pathway pseudopilin PulG
MIEGKGGSSMTQPCQQRARSISGMTLVEIVVALAISTVAVAAIVTGYLFSITSAQRSALSLVASARAMERIEQARSAKWDMSSWPSVDQLVDTNFPVELVTLDQGRSGTNITYGTNFTRISQMSVNPPLKEIRVDCVWNFKGSQLITNTIETCRAPDQ